MIGECAKRTGSDLIYPLWIYEIPFTITNINLILGGSAVFIQFAFHLQLCVIVAIEDLKIKRKIKK